MLTKRRKVNMSGAKLKNQTRKMSPGRGEFEKSGSGEQNSVYIGMGLLLMVLGGGGYAPLPRLISLAPSGPA